MYSMERAMRSTFALRASTTPQGRGEPSILWPLMEMLSAPSAKSQGCGFSTKGRIIPLSAASAWM
jgi:hypothetical protein